MVQQGVHGGLTLSAHHEVRVGQRLLRQKRDMRSAQDHGDAQGAALTGQGVAAVGGRGDGRDADQIGSAVAGDPGGQIEPRAAFNEDARIPAVAAIDQARQDERAQTRQSELAEDVDMGRGGFDKENLLCHKPCRCTPHLKTTSRAGEPGSRLGGRVSALCEVYASYAR